jgi:methionyl-tRNA formyltransferase
VGGEVAGPPGSLRGAKGRLFASCGGSTSLELVEVQMEGKRRMSAAHFLNGYQLGENEKLEMSR